MKKLFLSVLFLAFLGNLAFSQAQLSLQGSYAFANLKSENGAFDELMQGFGGGLSLRGDFKKRLQVGLSLGYQFMGYKDQSIGLKYEWHGVPILPEILFTPGSE